MNPRSRLIALLVVFTISSASSQAYAMFCSDPSFDDNGDGWGWENGETCLAILPGLSAPLVSLGIERICLEDSDSDGDGWGWEQNRSCVALETIDADAETASIARDSEGFPVCEDPASDPDGDGFGFENRRSCRVGGEIVTTTTGTASDLVITGASVIEVVAAISLADIDLLTDTGAIDTDIGLVIDGDDLVDTDTDDQDGSEVNEDSEIERPDSLASSEEGLIELDDIPETEDDSLRSSLRSMAAIEDNTRLCGANESSEFENEYGRFSLHNILNVTVNDLDAEEIQCIELTDGDIRLRYNYPIQALTGDYGHPRVSIPIRSIEDDELVVTYQYTAVSQGDISVVLATSYSNDCVEGADDHEVSIWLEGSPGIDGTLQAVTVGNERWNVIQVDGATHFIAPSEGTDRRTGRMITGNYINYLQAEDLLRSSGACLSRVEFGTRLTSGFGTIDIGDLTVSNL